MKTVLILAEQPGLAEAIRSVLDAGRYRVVYQSEVRPGDVLLTQGRVDACILDAELTTIRPIRTIETVRRFLPLCPILVYAGAKQWEWEEEAYLLGVGHVLNKPVRGRLLNSLLERFWPPDNHPPERQRLAPPARPPTEVPLPEPVRPSQKALEILRNFSALLPHSLSTEAILKQFLLLLRETVAVNRAAIFLCPSPEIINETRNPDELRRLRPMCAIGLPAGLLQHFTLSLDSGVGGHISREGRILRRDGDEVRNDPAIQKEFELLGAEVALPILDREMLMGVASFDRRVTGDSLGNEELALIFYMLEGLGMAIKNIWLHEEVATNHQMMEDILRQLNSGCVVIGRDLSVQHANKMARDCFSPSKMGEISLEFGDLPQALGSRVFEALNSGVAIPPFKYRPPGSDDRIYQITIAPFQKQHRDAPSAVLLLVEDCTQAERLQRVEVEASNLRMVKTMAERLAHEIGNAVVPLSTHQQLLAQKYKDPEFRASLESAMADGVKRIARLGQQMLFLAQDRPSSSEPIAVSRLIEDAFREAQKQHGDQPVFLQFESGGQSLTLAGDRAGLKHALAEVMLNALQANSPAPKVKVNTRQDADSLGASWVHIEVQDSGTGFTSEASRKAPDPFFTTRNVGLGLGLTVTRKIIETHHGRLEIGRNGEGECGVVTISLPLSGPKETPVV
jgi:signal transduction histidine kinase/DNA-binding NarL/FixJ family response regulator